MLVRGWREIRGRRISTWAVQAYRVEAMVYGIEASADSMCNSEKTALGEIYWRGVIKKEKQTEIWPDANDSTACSHSGPLLYFRQSARDKVILSESVLQSTTHRDTYHSRATHPQTFLWKHQWVFFFLKKSILLKQNAYLHCRGNFPYVGTISCTFTKEGNVYKNAFRCIIEIQMLWDTPKKAKLKTFEL